MLSVLKNNNIELINYRIFWLSPEAIRRFSLTANQNKKMRRRRTLLQKDSPRVRSGEFFRKDSHKVWKLIRIAPPLDVHFPALLPGPGQIFLQIYCPEV
jgi:hypothetical protein